MGWIQRASLALAAVGVAAQQTGVHPEWPRWCGKVYQPEYPNFDPGGQLTAPEALDGAPRLFVSFAPRYNLYLDSETAGEVLVSAESSQHMGVEWDWPSSSTEEEEDGASYENTNTTDSLVFFTLTIGDSSNGTSAALLLESNVAVNSTMVPFSISLVPIPVTLSQQTLTLTYGSSPSSQPHTVSAPLRRLREPETGSVTRIDYLSRMLYHKETPEADFAPYLPYGFFAANSSFLALNDTGVIDEYADYGLNAMCPLTQYENSAFTLDYIQERDVRIMYDLREIWEDVDKVEETVKTVREKAGVWGYWGVDEPDGQQFPFANLTSLYALMKQIDPYHPTSNAFNCQNYYYANYTSQSQTDLVMSDPYPIGTNATYSKWNTPCNLTYGDCGCDNCQSGTVLDVAGRFDDFLLYDKWLGRELGGPPVIFIPQSFNGEGYWLRDPTRGESVVMAMLALNRGVSGILSWIYPTSDTLGKAHGDFAKVVTGDEFVGFLAAGRATLAKAVVVPDYQEPGALEGLARRRMGKRDSVVSVADDASDKLDVAYWIAGESMLVSVVNGGEDDLGTVTIEIPGASEVESILWADDDAADWTLEDGVLTGAMNAMSVSLVTLKL